MDKIVSKTYFKDHIRPELKKEGKTIALCHGVFDLVHPGHLTHFEQAAKMGDVLVVSVTSAPFVRKGPGRPYFNDEQRLRFLSAIECIDYVILSEGYTVDDIVESVEPDLYIKGSEYADEDADLTGKIREERELVERHGGHVAYTGGEVFSSTNLINHGLSGMDKELLSYMEGFSKRYSMGQIQEWADRVRDLRILVIGDVIIDKYTYCVVNGLMSKDIGYAAREQFSEEYLGGSLAVARHLSTFCSNVSVISVIGNEPGMKKRITEGLDTTIVFNPIISESFPTIVKHRYLMKNEKREEYKKIFAVNNIPEPARLDEESKRALCEHLSEQLDSYDVVFVCDFGHGLLGEEMIRLIEQNSRYMVLNCQTNSSNYGMNLITKYRRTDAFAMNEKELKLAFPEYAGDESQAFRKLYEQLGAKAGYLTRGSQGALCYDGTEEACCPAFSLTVKDTVGSGDAFLAVSGVFEAAGAPVEAGMFAGNIAGALAANIIGNKDAVEKVNVLKYASTLMNV